MITLTNLRAQLQNRIDAVTGATTTNDLLNLRKACESMGVNHAALDAVIQARVNAVSGATSSIDLLKLSKLAIRGDKRIGEIVKSPIKADTLDDGALIRMAGNVVVRSAFPALAEVYQEQLQFGAVEDLGATAVSLSISNEFIDAHCANGVLMAVSSSGILRTTDGASYARINRSGLCLCWDQFNNRWWLGAAGGLIYFSVDGGTSWSLNSGKAGVANENIVKIKADGLGRVVCIWQNTGAGTTGGYITTNNGGAWAALAGSAQGSTFMNIDLQYFSAAKRWFILNTRISSALSLIDSVDGTSWGSTVTLPGSATAPNKLHSVGGSPVVTKWGVHAAFMLSPHDPSNINRLVSLDGWLKGATNIIQLDSGHVIYDSTEGIYTADSLSSSKARLALTYPSGYQATNETTMVDTPWGLYRFGRNSAGGSGRTYKLSKRAYNTATEMFLPDMGLDENMNYSYMVAK
jgi:hypothetical protein